MAASGGEAAWAVANMLGAALQVSLDAERTQQKINGQHLERLAIVYPRQSSPRQVRENIRSTERQYGLADKASELAGSPSGSSRSTGT